MSTYAINATIQKSAKLGPKIEKVDASQLDATMSALFGQGNYSIGLEDAKKILAKTTDGKAYTNAEKPITRAILRAINDSFAVIINGEKVELTDAAEKFFAKELPKFFGSLGGAASYAKGGGNHYKLKSYDGTPLEIKFEGDAGGMLGPRRRNADGTLRSKRADATLRAYLPADLQAAFKTVGQMREAFGGASVKQISRTPIAARAAIIAASQGSNQQSPAVQAAQLAS